MSEVKIEQVISHIHETMRDISCEFKVFRKRRSDHVISIAIWKKSIGYVLNLSTSILWWIQNMEVFFPNWNVRFYIDSSITTRKLKGDKTPWNDIISNMKKHNNVEVWLGYCPWGDDNTDINCNKCHINTFNSLLRFHATVDKSVKIAVMKNVELLTSPKDARLIHDWVNNTDKKYYFICDPNYICKYTQEHPSELCIKSELQNEIMILATFGTRNGIGIPDYFDQVSKVIFKSNSGLSKYVYGVDEIVLTKLIKPLMTFDNTYLILRESFGQWLPLSNKNYNFFFDAFQRSLNNVLQSPLSDLDKEILGTNPVDPDLNLEDEYETKQAIRNITVYVISIEQKSPDMLVKILKNINNGVMQSLATTESKRFQESCEDTYTAMQKFYFERFKTNKTGSTDDLNFFAAKANSEIQAKILFVVGLKTIIFELLDWPGYCVKTKIGLKCYPDLKLTDYLINERIGQRRRSSKINRALKIGKTEEEEVELVKKILIKEHETKKSDHDKNIEIFKRNLKKKLFDKEEETYV